MTDDIRGNVVDPAAAQARDRRGRRLMALVGILTVASFLVLASLLWSRGNELQQQVDTLAGQAQQAQAGWQTVASQVRQLGGTPKAVPPAGPIGPQGPAGANGRGITGTAISGGHLYLTYSDGVTEDKGQVVGAAGAKGADGRGITGANATSGHLVLSYSDGTDSDAGAVVGPQGAVGATGPAGADGRGIKSVSTAGGQLTVTYTDGTTADAGPLPAGPPGPTGPTGPQGVQGPPGSPPAGWTWTDELGRTYHCQRDPSSPDTAPTYTCSTAAPTSTAAARTRTTSR